MRIYRKMDQTWLVPLPGNIAVYGKQSPDGERLTKTALNNLDIVQTLDTLPNGLYTTSKYSSCPPIEIIFRLGDSVNRASSRIPPKATSRGIGLKVVEDVVLLQASRNSYLGKSGIW